MAEGRRPGRPRRTATVEQGNGSKQPPEDLFGGFEWYQAQRYRFPRQLSSVSIQKNGQLSISEDLAMHLIIKDGRGQVVIGYNTPTRRIAIRPVDEETPGSLRIAKPSAKGTRYVVDAHRFLDMHDLLPEKRVSCDAEWIESQGQGAVFFTVPELGDSEDQ